MLRTIKIKMSKNHLKIIKYLNIYIHQTEKIKKDELNTLSYTEQKLSFFSESEKMILYINFICLEPKEAYTKNF